MPNPGTLAVGVGLGLCVCMRLMLQRRGQGKWRSVKRLKPLIRVDRAGHLEHLEPFGAYVVRQLGLQDEGGMTEKLRTLAGEYMRADDDARRTLIEQFVGIEGSVDGEGEEWEARKGQLFTEIDKELHTCMMTYLGFHWRHSAAIIEQVLKGPESKHRLRDTVSKVTRDARFQKVLQKLQKTRQWDTLVELSKSLRQSSSEKGELVTAVPHNERPPVLLLVGGGMGAGKSTAVKEFLKTKCFWRQVVKEAVVVEADAFKEKDVVYHQLSKSRFSDDVDSIAAFVHESSTKAASSLLVSSLNEGRDVIFDGTLSWAPFVVETIAMARDVHKRPYRIVRDNHRFHSREDGVVEEKYWEPIEDCFLDEDEDAGFTTADGLSSLVSPSVEDDGSSVHGAGGAKDNGQNGDGDVGTTSRGGSGQDLSRLEERSVTGGSSSRGSSGRWGSGRRPFLPYRIELVGVACDASIAVARGIRRAILIGRGVPIERQLRSHRLFAESLELYTSLVDTATLYSTNETNSLQVIAMKDNTSRLLKDLQEYPAFERLAKLNDKASSALEVYKAPRSLFSVVQSIVSGLVPSYSHVTGRSEGCSESGVGPLTPWAARVAEAGRQQRQALLREKILEDAKVLQSLVDA